MCGHVTQVLEETGLDIESMLNVNHYLEVKIEQKLHKLFIIAGLDPETVCFAPKVQKVCQNLAEARFHFWNMMPCWPGFSAYCK